MCLSLVENEVVFEIFLGETSQKSVQLGLEYRQDSNINNKNKNVQRGPYR